MEFLNCQPQIGSIDSSSEKNHAESKQGQLNLAYYNLFKDLYFQSQKLKHQHFQIQKRQTNINNRIQTLTEKAQHFKDAFRVTEKKQKKIERRGEDQMEKEFTCHIPFCGRSYGSQTACRRHIKLKHPEVYSPHKKGRSQNEALDINDFITLNF